MSANGKKIAAAAVSGLMAVGSLPVAAIAETAQATSVETQATSAYKNAVDNSDLTFTYHGKQYTQTAGQDVNIAETDYNMTDTQVTLQSLGDYTFQTMGDNSTNDFEIRDSAGTLVGYAHAEIGNYGYNVGDYRHNGYLHVDFSFVNFETASRDFYLNIGTRSLTDGLAFAKVSDNGQVSLGDATYNGTSQTVALFYNGLRVDESQIHVVSVSGVDEDGNPVATTPTVNSDGTINVTNAGTYTVAIQAVSGEPYGSKTGTVTFKVAKLNLSNADVQSLYVAAATTPLTNPQPTSTDYVIDGYVPTYGLKITAVPGSYDSYGTHTYKVEADSSSSKDVEGAATVDTIIVADVGSIFYDGNQVWGTSNLPTSITYNNLDEGNNKFDPSKFAAYETPGVSGDEISNISISYWNLDTNSEATLSDVQTKSGNYRITVEAQQDPNYTAGAKAVFYITNYRGDQYNVTVNFAGINVYPGGVAWGTYNGSAQNPTVTVTRVKSDKTEETLDASQYEVHYYKTDKFNGKRGDEVTDITNAGWYQVIVTGKDGENLDYGDRVTYIYVAPQSVVYQVSDSGQKTYTTTSGKVTYYPYTGSAITPTFEFFAKNAKGDYIWNGTKIVSIDSLTEKEFDAIAGNDRFEKVDIDADGYTVTYHQTQNGKTENVSSIVDKGVYEATVSDAKPDEEDNYAITWQGWNQIRVSGARRFSDVATDAWYADVISDAADAGYVHGYDKTDLFGPEDKITRGQVACILYNVASQDGKVDETLLHYDSEKGFQTDFSDVDGNAYYAKAVAWASQAGVVHGYGDGTFKADQYVTREEFAAMLANYASKVDGYEAGSASDLASFADADQVSDWAKDVVAWAVHNKVMGNGGFIAPQASITRAETAAMVMNWVNVRK